MRKHAHQIRRSSRRKENSYKYGFIFRYPGDRSDMTGISEEVWHYRCVGVQAATEIYEQGICLEEY